MTPTLSGISFAQPAERSIASNSKRGSPRERNTIFPAHGLWPRGQRDEQRDARLMRCPGDACGLQPIAIPAPTATPKVMTSARLEREALCNDASICAGLLARYSRSSWAQAA